MKKFLLSFIVIVIIVFSFITPKLLFAIEDTARAKEIFARAKNESKIDVQAENIYLVKTLHELYMAKKVYDIKTSSTVIAKAPTTEYTDEAVTLNKVKEETKKMIDIGILKNINLDEYSSNATELKVFSKDCTIITDNLSKDNTHGIGVVIEEKTGKIISLDFNKQIFRMEVSQRKQLEDFVKYLELDIIDDWKYENGVLVSEKAQLTVMIDYGEYGCVLNISPTEIYNEYYEMVDVDE